MHRLIDVLPREPLDVDARIQAVLTLIRNHPAREFKVAILAQTANVSASHLRHLFKSETGTTPAQFIKTVRMEHAELLLRTTFLSVKEIMNQVGIYNESYFSREFKRIYGLPPTRYRRNQEPAPD